MKNKKSSPGIRFKEVIGKKAAPPVKKKAVPAATSVVRFEEESIHIGGIYYSKSKKCNVKVINMTDLNSPVICRYEKDGQQVEEPFKISDLSKKR